MSSADGVLQESLKEKGFEIEFIAPSSWVCVIKNILPPEGNEFEQVWSEHPPEVKKLKIHGREVDARQYQQAYGKTHKYSGTLAVGIEETPLIKQIQAQLNELIRVAPEGSSNNYYKFNSCLCNWYEPDQCLGAHSDDIRTLVARSPIVGLSWGATRVFTFTARSKDPTPNIVLKKRIPMESGDVVIMGGDCQETHKHEIEKLKKGDVRGNRVSFTFRCFKS